MPISGMYTGWDANNNDELCASYLIHSFKQRAMHTRITCCLTRHLAPAVLRPCLFVELIISLKEGFIRRLVLVSRVVFGLHLPPVLLLVFLQVLHHFPGAFPLPLGTFYTARGHGVIYVTWKMWYDLIVKQRN